jgi:hypothetical protein
MRRRSGRAAATLLARLHREQITLAMLVDQAGGGDDASVAMQRSGCRSLRLALDAIPGAGSTADRGGPSTGRAPAAG